MTEFWKSVGKRHQPNTQRFPRVTARDIHFWFPNSVYQSLMDNADWISTLKISTCAKWLSRKRGCDFKLAVQREMHLKRSGLKNAQN